VVTGDRYWLKSKKWRERSRYEGKQSETTRPINALRLYGREFYSAVRATSVIMYLNPYLFSYFTFLFHFVNKEAHECGHMTCHMMWGHRSRT